MADPSSETASQRASGSTSSGNALSRISAQSAKSTMSSRSAGRTSMKPNDQQHVEYILVAQFDIDSGSQMEHQYPDRISGDENMLAELMLPDGAHVRDQDWTIFFLHKGADQSEEEQRDADGQVPLIYVLNLVITKHDKSYDRGAKVKAMAICTRHSFLHIYKPILLLALEEYFKNPTRETLMGIHHSVNSMDLSGMPELSTFERQILAGNENKEMFREKFEEAAEAADEALQGQSTPDGEPEPAPHVMERRGTTYIDLATSNKKVVVNGKMMVSRDTHDFDTKVVYNGIPVPIKVPVAILPETVGDFSSIQLISTFSTPHTQNPQPFALHPHLTTNGPYTHPIIVLINGLLTQKRIVFLSLNRPSGEVANHVLAACALASGGVLRGFTRHAFPYTNLSGVGGLLDVPGYIAGVKNPAFANKPNWWDILCNIDTGRIKISPEIKQPGPTEEAAIFSGMPNVPSHADTGDNAFMDDVVHCISARLGEKAIRAKFRDWVIRFTHLAAAYEELVFGASALWIGHEENHVIRGHGLVWADELSKMKDIAANRLRIEGWRPSRSYHAFVQDVQTNWMAKPIKLMDVNHQLDRLRMLRMGPDESGRIYKCLKEYVHGYEEINQLLCALPENQGGLFPVAVGLFHPQVKVRFAVVELLERLSVHLAGKHFFNSMNRFQRLAFVRIQQEKFNTADSPVATNGLNMAGLSLGNMASK